jgi:DNA-directed RNA polymerase specialized sigma24 family protein
VDGAASFAFVNDLDAQGEDERSATWRNLRSVVADAYDAHQRELYAFCVPVAIQRWLGSWSEVPHLVREVKHGRPENIRAWLYRVTANLVLSRGRRLTVADRWQHLLVARDTPGRITALRHEGTGALETALGGLSRDARTALLLAASGWA